MSLSQSHPCRITDGPQPDCEDSALNHLTEEQEYRVLDELWPQSRNNWRDMYADEDGDVDLQAALDSALFNRPREVEEIAREILEGDRQRRHNRHVTEAMRDIFGSSYGQG